MLHCVISHHQGSLLFHRAYLQHLALGDFPIMTRAGVKFMIVLLAIEYTDTVKYFSQNIPAPQDPPHIPQANVDPLVDFDPTTKNKIYQAIKQLKNGKSAVPDSLRAEALQTDIETSVEVLHPLFKKIWEEEQVPPEWAVGYLIKLPKKGDLSSCTSCRGIALLPIPGKVGAQSSATEQDEIIMQLTPSLGTSRPAFARAGPVQTRLQLCASS